MPMLTVHDDNGPMQPGSHKIHIGMRKIKSILAIFMGFCLWQTLRLFIPGLEVHPLFIYIYGMIEIRESSSKTKDLGKKRIMATLVAISIGLPIMLITDSINPLLTESGTSPLLQIFVLVTGALVVLLIAEWIGCGTYCGLAAAIYIILMVSHFERSVYLYSVMRAFQTIIGVCIAWFINVKLLPYPAKPGTFSFWLSNKLGGEVQNVKRIYKSKNDLTQ